MKLSEVKIGDRIRVTTQDQGDTFIAEITVTGIEAVSYSDSYRFYSDSGSKVFGESIYGTKVELLDRPKTLGEIAFDGFYSVRTKYLGWDDLNDQTRKAWESAGQCVAESIKEK